MKINWNNIKIMSLVVAVLGLYAFSNKRNASKNIEEISIQFVGDQRLYITEAAVNKLLIQNYGKLNNVRKEKLVLNTIEKIIEANKMVKKAQVYLSINGKLEARIIQRKPIGRVEGDEKFYLDDDGKRMPFSTNHSARVPLITGNITGKGLNGVYEILKYVNTDEFLRKNVIGVHVEDKEKYELRFRMNRFVVNLGSNDDLEKKFNNFKAFYAKANKDKTLNNYDIVSLEFNNQVVCTKI